MTFLAVRTVMFYMLCDFEIEEEIYCFAQFTIAKYGRICILIGRNIPYRGIPFVPPKFIIIIWDERESTIGNISSDYTTNSSIFGYRKNYETIYFFFHFNAIFKKSLCVVTSPLHRLEQFKIREPEWWVTASGRQARTVPSKWQRGFCHTLWSPQRPKTGCHVIIRTLSTSAESRTTNAANETCYSHDHRE